MIALLQPSSGGWSPGLARRAHRSTMAWVVLLILGLRARRRMSWSHVRRRISGQASVDRVDD